MAAALVRAALAEVAKALGHAHRVELIEQLAQGPRSVEALAARVSVDVAELPRSTCSSCAGPGWSKRSATASA